MITEKQREQARAFQALHHQQKLFVLPNVWSVGSAYIYEKQGFPAIATSSAGLAYDLGYPDGEQITLENVIELTERITKRVDRPLSVDFERGYGDTPEEVRENARKLLFAGAVGFNLEDGKPDGTLTALPLQLAKIRALAELKKELNLDFVINARTCAYLLQVADEDTMYQIACERGRAFLEAGADCVFIPGALPSAVIAGLVKEIPGPINILLTGKTKDFAMLQDLGVRRLSIGSGIARYVYGKTIGLAKELYAWDAEEILNHDFSLPKADQYFDKHSAL